MPAKATSITLPLPKAWRRVTRVGVLHAISVASMAMTSAWSKASRSTRQQALAEADRLRREVALLTAELELKDARWARLTARRRPFYGPIQRMRILELRAARGWSNKQVADRFMVTEETIASWMRRLDEDGEAGLVRLAEPVNRFQDFVAYLVRYLKQTCPHLGKERIAKMLARAGLHLGTTTVGRMLKRDLTEGDIAIEEPEPATGRVVTAMRPNHVWHVDLTTVPTNAGFWLPWAPYSQFQRWPFCWWVAIVVDHASRLVVGFAVFKRRPTSFEVYSFIGTAIHRSGAKPRYMISDKRMEFDCQAYRDWCRRRGIRPRYGAVGKHGSIALIERFIRSMKSEYTRRIIVPFSLNQMRGELTCYTTWYNEHRPHTALLGRTPMEAYRGLPAANEASRIEPRSRWPRGSRCASPVVPVHGNRGERIALVLNRFENRTHLPVVEFRRAS